VYIMQVDTCVKLLSVEQVSTTGTYPLLVPPGQTIPVALLRLPDVYPTSGIHLNQKRTQAAKLATRILRACLDVGVTYGSALDRYQLRSLTWDGKLARSGLASPGWTVKQAWALPCTGLHGW
jgi:hypothetical protein